MNKTIQDNGIQPDRTRQPAVSTLAQWTVQTPERLQMPNGVTLHLLRADEGDVVRLDFIFWGGRWQQSQPLQALFTNRMLREGTARFTSAQIAERLDYYGAWLELSSSSECACITLYSLCRYLPQTLELLESIVKEPLFPDHELEVVVKNNLQQFRVNSSKVGFQAQRALMETLFGRQHPCGHVTVEDDYLRITPDVLRSFFRQHYHSGNCFIYLSGRVDDEVVGCVERLFGTTPFGDTHCLLQRPRFEAQPLSGSRVFISRPDAVQSAVRMGLLAVECTHPHYLPLRVLVTLFGGYFGSRLMSNIREEKGYTYGISAALLPYPGCSLLLIQSETANEYVEPLIAEVGREVDRLQREPVSPAELDVVKNYMRGELCRSCDSVFSLADAWIYAQVTGMPHTCLADQWHAIASVTPDDLLQLARRYLRREMLKEAVAGKKNA